ncbi:MAG: ABC transporter ATP-binding protein [bacterium]|nr:ABC transporter ATP-binding protein [bacterium]
MPLIAIDQLTKTYGDGETATHALRGISLVIERGEYVAVMGPSGSGKSTLLHLLGLLDRPTSGAYILDGVPVATRQDDAMAKIRNERIGFIFQQFNLLARATVRENVQLPLLYSDVPEREWPALVERAIARVGLTHRTDHTRAQLSGGEQQRVAVARALARDPQIVFADEPTGNLDSASGKQVMELLEHAHADGRTVILITHEQTTAEHAQRIIRLRDGRIESDTLVVHRRRARDFTR